MSELIERFEHEKLVSERLTQTRLNNKGRARRENPFNGMNK
jgi:hypothetical protein